MMPSFRLGRGFQVEQALLFFTGRLLEEDRDDFQILLAGRVNGKADRSYKIEQRLDSESSLVRKVVAARLLNLGVVTLDDVAEQNRPRGRVVENIVEIELVLDGEADHCAYIGDSDLQKSIRLEHMMHPAEHLHTVVPVVVFQNCERNTRRRKWRARGCEAGGHPRQCRSLPWDQYRAGPAASRGNMKESESPYFLRQH